MLPPQKRSTRWLSLGLVLLGLAGLSYTVYRWGALRDLPAILQASGPWAPLLGLLLMVLQTLVSPIPYAAVVVALGATLGPLEGGLVAWAGELLGASAAYWLARAGWRAQSSPDWLSGRSSFWKLLTLRLMPGLSLDLVSYACGAARVHFPAFLAATAVGMVPRTALLVLFGHSLWDVVTG